MTKVLVSDPIDQAGIDILTQVAQVDQKVGLSTEQLKQVIGEYDGLMIRSGTQVTSDVISTATKLRIIGRAGVGGSRRRSGWDPYRPSKYDCTRGFGKGNYSRIIRLVTNSKGIQLASWNPF